MKLPRGISGHELAKLLGRFDYAVVRQTGSHMRLTTSRNGQHHVTIPAHAALRIGTLNGIIGDVAAHLGMTKDALATELFDD